MLNNEYVVHIYLYISVIAILNFNRVMKNDKAMNCK